MNNIAYSTELIPRVSLEDSKQRGVQAQMEQVSKGIESRDRVEPVSRYLAISFEGPALASSTK